MANPSSRPTVTPEAVHVAPIREFLSNAELEELTGIDRSTWWLLRRRRVDPAPCLKVGGRVLWQREAILRWLDNQRERPAAEPRRRGRPRKATPGVWV